MSQFPSLRQPATGEVNANNQKRVGHGPEQRRKIVGAVDGFDEGIKGRDAAGDEVAKNVNGIGADAEPAESFEHRTELRGGENQQRENGKGPNGVRRRGVARGEGNVRGEDVGEHSAAGNDKAFAD